VRGRCLRKVAMECSSRSGARIEHRSTRL
jgi:hypothetical protein